MSIDVVEATIGNVLTRTSGYLRTVTTHSLQPYRGCTFGNALCGAGCYVQHNGHILKGRTWGGFLEVRTNAAQSYLAHEGRERAWAVRRMTAAGGAMPSWAPGPFTIFCSSATDPFVPQEFRYGVTRSILNAMLGAPPDGLILQTHSHRVVEYLELFRELSALCDLRMHVSIETDRERLPGLPPHASSVARRFESCRILRDAGLRTVITVSPLLPIDDPEEFFRRASDCADAVVIDHFIEGDGSADGSRTRRTVLPMAMAAVLPASTGLGYREQMVEIASRFLPGRVGVSVDGFAGRYF